MSSEWWCNKKYYVDEIENEDTHLLFVYYKDGEYAIVRWRFKTPTLLYTLKNGKVIWED